MSSPDHRTPLPTLAGALAAAGLAAHALPALAAAWPPLRAPLGIEDRTASGRGFAITFDDGPHAQGSAAMLEILSSAQAQATFFMVGEQVRRAPTLAAEIAAAGHAVGLHCDRHRNLLRLTPVAVRDDIARAQETIERATGRQMSLYRPPYGLASATALRIAASRGWRTLLWSHWGRDWEARATPATIASRATADAWEGSVLLLHDADDYSAAGSWRRTAAALPQILDIMRARGLQAVAP